MLIVLPDKFGIFLLSVLSLISKKLLSFFAISESAGFSLSSKQEFNDGFY